MNPLKNLFSKTKKLKKHTFFMIRYSLLNPVQSFWKISRDIKFEEYKQRLFDPERLKLHEQLFANVTLPSIVNMSPNPNDFSLLVFTSEDLPKEHLEKLNGLLSPYSWAKAIQLPSNLPSEKAIHNHFRQELERFNETVLYSTVRIDDDDAIAPYFCNELERYLTPVLSGYCVSFPKGYAGIYESGQFESFHPFYEPKIGLGLAYINTFDPGSPSNEANNIYDFGGHPKVDQHRPVILDAKKPMYIRSIHSAGDSYGQKKKERIGSTEDVSDEVKKIFPNIPQK